MRKIENAVEKLIAAMADTDVYREYSKARDRVAPAEMENINSYKRLRASLMENSSPEDEYRAKELCRSLMLNPDTRNYILCEKKILNMVAGVYDDIGSGLITGKKSKK